MTGYTLFPDELVWDQRPTSSQKMFEYNKQRQDREALQEIVQQYIISFNFLIITFFHCHQTNCAQHPLPPSYPCTKQGTSGSLISGVLSTNTVFRCCSQSISSEVQPQRQPKYPDQHQVKPMTYTTASRVTTASTQSCYKYVEGFTHIDDQVFIQSLG